MKEYPITDTVEKLDELIVRVKAAQQTYATFSQEQVDKIFHEAAMAANNSRVPLAKMAYEETGMGVIEDKVIKNHYASEYIYNAYKDEKTCGIIEEDVEYGITKIAEPIGVICAIIPTTNPTSTAIFKTLLALKTRNGIIISPHHRAKKSTIAAAKIVLEAAVAAGAPEDIIGWIDAPGHDMTHNLMCQADLTLATGGPGMVGAAYSSGKPAIGVGPGNTPAVIDSSANILLAVNSIIHSKTFDNGMICASEQSVIPVEDVYDAVKAEFIRRGCYFMNEEEKNKIRAVLLGKNNSVNPEIVGRPPVKIAALAGFTVPADTKILIGEVESVDVSEPFAHEKLSPILAMYKAHDIYDAIAKAEHLVSDGGRGHTSSIYVDAINHRDILEKFAYHMCTGRVLVNTPAAQGGLGDLYNFRLSPSLTLGCGSWGSNSVSENVGVKHLLNIKTVAERRENMLWFRSPEKVYIKKGCLPVALQELGAMGKKRAFIVTGRHLFGSGALKPIEEKLDTLGIVHQVFFDVASDPTLACARAGAEQMRLFQPDVIIAVGGGSPMDAAKIMWVLYEHPDADFGEMAMRFADIRKRVYTFPHMGEKAYFVAVPTSAGTGSEVTPFAVITDEKSGIKYPLADYELMPDMAIVDADMNMTAPKGLTASSGIDAAVHALEAYASMMATDYTDGLALRALKLVFEYLPRAYDNGTKDYEAREKMCNAATMAGMAFANAFLGVCHSMAHKLGAFHHVQHGTANALMLEEVLRFNASERPTKMGTFPQYDHPETLHRYAEVAEYLGLGGNTDTEKLENLIKALNDLKARVGLKKSIRDYVPDEKNFLDHLDEMSEQAFDDQCTAANPRYPLISEIRQMYLNAYYCGDEKPAAKAEEAPAAPAAAEAAPAAPVEAEGKKSKK